MKNILILIRIKYQSQILLLHEYYVYLNALYIILFLLLINNSFIEMENLIWKYVNTASGVVRGSILDLSPETENIFILYHIDPERGENISKLVDISE